MALDASRSSTTACFSPRRLGWRNGYEQGRLRIAGGFIDVAVLQVRGAGEPFRST
jgi:hypothetical protein